jgi:hypothetical protein
LLSFTNKGQFIDGLRLMAESFGDCECKMPGGVDAQRIAHRRLVLINRPVLRGVKDELYSERRDTLQISPDGRITPTSEEYSDYGGEFVDTASGELLFVGNTGFPPAWEAGSSIEVTLESAPWIFLPPRAAKLDRAKATVTYSGPSGGTFVLSFAEKRDSLTRVGADGKAHIFRRVACNLPGDRVGTDRCKACHEAEHASWLKRNNHSRAHVECEACHGGGASYAFDAVMRDRARARAAGLIIPGEGLCAHCHGPEGPHKAVDLATARIHDIR